VVIKNFVFINFQVELDLIFESNFCLKIMEVFVMNYLKFN